MFSKEQVYGKGGDVGPIRLARSSRMKRSLYAWGLLHKRLGEACMVGSGQSTFVWLYFRKHKIIFKILNEAFKQILMGRASIQNIELWGKNAV